MTEPATILEVLEKEKERQDNGEFVKPVHDRAQAYSWGLRNYVQLRPMGAILKELGEHLY
jgi:hypothetical protein